MLTFDRTVRTFLLLLSLSFICLPAHGRCAAQDTPETPQEIVFSLLKGGNGKMLYFMCDSQVQQAVDIGSLNSLWKNLEAQAGKYVSHDRNVTECAVQTKSWTLPALLTGPDSKRERTPIVILVHGSGPNDKDGSIGPNKVFKELAEELAAHGIASLRYDKRTLIYGQGAFSNPEKVTLEEETIDDAVSAAALAGSMGFRHIFILGHSLGAACAPLIALQCSTSGIIMMAAPARPMKEMLEEQTKVVSQYNSPETMEQLRKATEAIQADYLKEVDYDRIQTAQKIVGKDIPTLILQGERDYQVTMEDFGIWKEAFSTACGTDGSDVTGKECVIDSDIIMKSYPGLNHTIP